MLGKDAKMELIRSVPLFEDCSRKELREIAAAADEVVVPAGYVLTKEGASGKELVVIVEGAAEVRRRGRKINELGSGDFLGEIALISGSPRTATVRTTQPTHALVLTGQAFRATRQDDSVDPDEGARGARAAPAVRPGLASYTCRMAATATQRALLIDGEWVETGDWIEVRSPYSGDVVARVAKGGAEETRRALDAAERALAEPAARAQARGDPRQGRRSDRQAPRRGGAHDLRRGGQADQDGARRGVARDVDVHVRGGRGAQARGRDDPDGVARRPARASSASRVRKPIGIIGAISPFNFPCNLVAHKLAPALAAGCPVVLKPASQTPLSALLLAELEQEAGLPAGWLNVIVGPASQIGDVLVEDERVKMITFTGSGDVGWNLQERAPRKRVKLELGNSTPVIVAADADVETAATKLAANAFAFAGQSCISVQRIYVERASYDAFVRSFVPKVEALVVGDPADDETDVGPVIDADARTRIAEWIEEARSSGAEVLTAAKTARCSSRP